MTTSVDMSVAVLLVCTASTAAIEDEDEGDDAPSANTGVEFGARAAGFTPITTLTVPSMLSFTSQ